MFVVKWHCCCCSKRPLNKRKRGSNDDGRFHFSHHTNFHQRTVSSSSSLHANAFVINYFDFYFHSRNDCKNYHPFRMNGGRAFCQNIAKCFFCWQTIFAIFCARFICRKLWNETQKQNWERKREISNMILEPLDSMKQRIKFGKVKCR